MFMELDVLYTLRLPQFCHIWLSSIQQRPVRQSIRPLFRLSIRSALARYGIATLRYASYTSCYSLPFFVLLSMLQPCCLMISHRNYEVFPGVVGRAKLYDRPSMRTGPLAGLLGAKGLIVYSTSFFHCLTSGDTKVCPRAKRVDCTHLGLIGICRLRTSVDDLDSADTLITCYTRLDTNVVPVLQFACGGATAAIHTHVATFHIAC